MTAAKLQQSVYLEHGWTANFFLTWVNSPDRTGKFLKHVIRLAEIILYTA